MEVTYFFSLYDYNFVLNGNICKKSDKVLTLRQQRPEVEWYPALVTLDAGLSHHGLTVYFNIVEN